MLIIVFLKKIAKTRVYCYICTVMQRVIFSAGL